MKTISSLSTNLKETIRVVNGVSIGYLHINQTEIINQADLAKLVADVADSPGFKDPDQKQKILLLASYGSSSNFHGFLLIRGTKSLVMKLAATLKMKIGWRVNFDKKPNLTNGTWELKGKAAEHWEEGEFEELKMDMQKVALGWHGDQEAVSPST